MSTIYIPSLKADLVPTGFELLEGLESLYELEFALAEIKSLSKEELVKRSAYFGKIGGEETIHHKLCAGPSFIGTSASTRLKAFFERFQFKTGYATHGLFPYRGKFHPQLIKGLMNIMKLVKEDTVLDPMTGSGTTNVEASIVGLNSIGIDSNPFCVFMTRTKADALRIEKEDLQNCRDVEMVFDFFSKSSEAQLGLEEISPFELLKNRFNMKPTLRNLFLLCYLDSLSYSKRRKNKTAKDVFPIVYERYLNALQKFIGVRDENNLKLGDVFVAEGDARNLVNLKSNEENVHKKIDDHEIDGIITSPPYYFSIDYLAEDRSQLEYMGRNIDELRENMIGLRGKDFRIKVELFSKDMDSVFSEMHRVLEKGKYASVIVGYNTVQMQRELKEIGVNLKEKIVSLASSNSLSLEKRVIRPIEGARNIMQTEDIFIFQNGKSD
jgi:DNA modification methylase